MYNVCLGWAQVVGRSGDRLLNSRQHSAAILRTQTSRTVIIGVNATGTLGGRKSSAEDARIDAP